MRAFAAIFKTGWQYLWRNPVSVSVLIGFPIVLIWILGNALSAYISPDTSLDPAPVAVVADENGNLARFLQSEEISRFFDLTFTDMAEAETLVRDGAVCAAVVEDAATGGVSVLRSSTGGLLTQLTLSVIDGYQQIGLAAILSGREIDPAQFAAINVTDAPLNKRIPNATDYYAVTMLVLILFYTGMNGMELFNKGLLGDTGNRIRLTPTPKPVLVGGLLASSTVTSFVQGMVTFIFSAVVYRVYWGDRLLLVLAALFAVVLLSQSVCIFLLLLCRAQGTAVAVSQVLIWTMAFVSKSYSKISFGSLDRIFQYSPNAMAHTVIFGAVYGGNEQKMALCLALLFGASGALFIGAFLLGRRKLL